MDMCQPTAKLTVDLAGGRVTYMLHAAACSAVTLQRDEMQDDLARGSSRLLDRATLRLHAEPFAMVSYNKSKLYLPYLNGLLPAKIQTKKQRVSQSVTAA